MRVIAWACHVDERDDIEVTNQTQDVLRKCKYFGGGGTELSCLTRYIEEKEYKTRLLVVLTDGYIESNPQLPEGTDCLFVLSRNGHDEVVKNHGDVTSLNHEKR
jgi:predicted metal-dependent peptidase